LDCDAVALVTDWNPAAIGSSSPSGIQGVTRLRPPRIPSVRPIVLGVCAAIVALMVIFFAIFANTASSREVDAASALFLRYVAVVLLVLSLAPFVASILFFVRYRRTQKAFNLGLQQFQDERNSIPRDAENPSLLSLDTRQPSGQGVATTATRERPVSRL